MATASHRWRASLARVAAASPPKRALQALLEAYLSKAHVEAANGGGAVVNVLSVLSWLTVPGSVGYSASKAAGWALGNALRQELKVQRTELLAVHAAFIDTDMARGARGPKTAPDEVVRQAIAALEAGAPELLADTTTRGVRGGVGSERPAYLGVVA